MAAELGLDFEHVPLTFDDPALRAPNFLRINPNGRIPAIDDDGLTLYESLAINLYLAKRYGSVGAAALYPESFEDEARAWQWSFWAMSELETPLETLRLHRAFLPEGKRDATAAEHAERQLHRPLAVLDGVLRGSAYLLGERFTVADLNVACVLSPSRTALIDLACYAEIRGWLRRCYGREAAIATRRFAATETGR